jgi:hypothetical protein
VSNACLTISTSGGTFPIEQLPSKQSVAIPMTLETTGFQGFLFFVQWNKPRPKAPCGTQSETGMKQG